MEKNNLFNIKRFKIFIAVFITLGFVLILFYFLVMIKNSPDNEKSSEFYENYYSNITQKNGVDYAFAKLKKDYDLHPDIKSDCHQITHAIGRAAAEKYIDVGQAFQHGDSFCWSGYYHGVMEGLLIKVKTTNMSGKINFICSNISGKEKYSFDYYNCVHGLGHGVMYTNENELFQSLKICDDLDGWWEQNSCYGGVFMENVISDDKYHFTKYLKIDDPFYPCNKVEEKYKGTCYLMQTSHMLDLKDWNFEKVFQLCSQVEADFQDTCYQSLGRDASGYTESDVEKTKRICMFGKDFQQRSNCVIGAAKDFVAYYHSATEAKKLCTSSPKRLKEMCFTTVNEFLGNF